VGQSHMYEYIQYAGGAFIYSFVGAVVEFGIRSQCWVGQAVSNNIEHPYIMTQDA